MEKVYLAARYGAKNQVSEIARRLKEMGHEVVSTWHSPDAKEAGYSTADDDTLNREAHADIVDMDSSTAFIALEHLGSDGSLGGRHVEFGYCIASGIPCAVTTGAESKLNLYHRFSAAHIGPSVENMAAWLDAMKEDRCTQTRIREQCRQIANMLVEKNRSYGDSALHPSRIFGQGSASDLIKVRIDDKLNRIKNAPDAYGEDVVKDMIGYLVLLRLALEDEKK